MVISDESTFCLDLGIKKVWRQWGEEILVEVPRRVKAINVYCFFSKHGFGKIVLIEGKMNKE